MGLTRFDGKTFYHKAIPEIYDNSTDVRDLEKTADGNIIFWAWMHGLIVQQNDGQFKNILTGKIRGVH